MYGVGSKRSSRLSRSKRFERFELIERIELFGVTPIDWAVMGPKLEYRTSEFLGLILFHSV
jgi:hypothetical protein